MRNFQDKRIDGSFLAVMFSMIFFLGLLVPLLAQYRSMPLIWKLFAGAYPLQISYLCIAFCFAARFPAGKNVLQTLDLTGVPSKVLLRTTLETAAVFLGLSLLTGLFTALLQKLSIPLTEQTVVQILRSGPDAALWILIFAALFAAPAGEELAFRHILYKKFSSLLPPGAAMSLSSLIFAAVHLNVQSFPALFLLGIFLSRTYSRHGSLTLCILMHSFFNAISIAMILLMRFQILPGS